MAEQKKSSAMIPLILIGAALFGFGTYQSMKPKEPEVNPTFVATPNTPSPPTTPSTATPANPLTMQAPDAPPIGKDAAQLAAAAGDTTNVPPQKSVLDDPWFEALKVGDARNFRARTMTALKDQQVKGVVNCRPSLAQRSDIAVATLEEVSCTATDGSTIESQFDSDNDGELRAKAPDGSVTRIERSGDAFSVRSEGPDQP